MHQREVDSIALEDVSIFLSFCFRTSGSMTPAMQPLAQSLSLSSFLGRRGNESVFEKNKKFPSFLAGERGTGRRLGATVEAQQQERDLLIALV